MPKKLSIPSKIVQFFCTSCNKKYELISGHTEDVVNIDICSNCHPFYLGKTNFDVNLGPAEKLKDKFARGKVYISKK